MSHSIPYLIEIFCIILHKVTRNLLHDFFIESNMDALLYLIWVKYTLLYQPLYPPPVILKPQTSYDI